MSPEISLWNVLQLGVMPVWDKSTLVVQWRKMYVGWEVLWLCSFYGNLSVCVCSRDVCGVAWLT